MYVSWNGCTYLVRYHFHTVQDLKSKNIYRDQPLLWKLGLTTSRILYLGKATYHVSQQTYNWSRFEIRNGWGNTFHKRVSVRYVFGWIRNLWHLFRVICHSMAPTSVLPGRTYERHLLIRSYTQTWSSFSIYGLPRNITGPRYWRSGSTSVSCQPPSWKTKAYSKKTITDTL